VRQLLLLGSLTLGAFGSFAACSGDSSNPNDDASTDVSSATDSPQASDVVTTKDGAPVDAAADAPAKPPCTANANKTGFTSRTAQGNAYVAYVPATYDPKTLWPLVVALHGAGDTAQNYLNVIWKANADADGFIVIAPEGTAPLGSGFTWNGSDETLILAAAQDVYACYAIDPKKEIMHGFSAGGIMAYMIGLDHAQLFSGISISSADLGSAEAIYGGNLLPSAWKIPVSHFHGTQDQNFPISYAIAGMNTLTDAGHTFYWHPFDGGHTTTPQFANTMYNDLKSSTAP
jgi:poly(3-hydroxybutyrate) depolymerase